jgi:hypothetical protein
MPIAVFYQAGQREEFWLFKNLGIKGVTNVGVPFQAS